MKLMYCPHCADIVRLFSEKRFCRCGKSWGHYLEDDATTVQTWPGLSIGIANPDFVQAERTFGTDVKHFSPALSMRCWINPMSEPDVKFVLSVPPRETESDDAQESAKPSGAGKPIESDSAEVVPEPEPAPQAGQLDESGQPTAGVG